MKNNVENLTVSSLQIYSMSDLKHFVYESLLQLLFDPVEYTQANDLLNPINLHEAFSISHGGKTTMAHWIRIY